MNKLALPLAAAGPLAIGAVIAARTGDVSTVVAAPAIVFGVVAATCPALYIGIAALGDAPPMARVARSFVVALAAFGVALAGLVLPAAFLSLSSAAVTTTVAVCSGAIAGAAVLGLWRLHGELETRTFSASIVFFTWSVATFGIAGRLWWDLANEVIS